MSSIEDIPYNEIVKFIKANGKSLPKSTTETYNLAFKLLKNKKSRGHTQSIIEWMVAYNLIFNKVNIPYYADEQIDNMNQSQINQLSKLLTMKSNNINTIKNVLRFLHKLEELKLLPEINQLILGTYGELESKEINVDKLTYKNVISLLISHRNKSLVRKLIYDNMERIIINNITGIVIHDEAIELEMFPLTDNKNFDIKVLNLYKNNLLEFYSKDQINKYIQDLNDQDDPKVELIEVGGDEMWIQESVDFLYDLINIDEISLFREAYEIMKNNRFGYDGHNIDFWLIFSFKDADSLVNILDFIGERTFIENFQAVINRFLSGNYVPPYPIYRDFFIKLIEYNEYDLLIELADYLIDTINLDEFHNVIKSRDDKKIMSLMDSYPKRYF